MSQVDMNKVVNYSIFWLALLCGLVGCAVPTSLQPHTVMGSVQTSYPNSVLTLQTETEKPSFHIKLFSIKNSDCTSGFIDYIEFDGEINKESLSTFESVLLEAQGCKNNRGNALYPFVYLNSSKGLINDGLALGQLLRKFNTETLVTQAQVCRGACAFAFLGGRLRALQQDAQLVFASDQARGIGIDCTKASDQVPIRNYAQKMLGLDVGDKFYFNLLGYCTQPSGWSLERLSAKTWSLTNE
jgi:hypothetical protein